MSRLWQQAYHIDYLAADIIRYFWRSRRRQEVHIAGYFCSGEIPSSDIDASAYESHVSHLSHASSLHSTAQSQILAPGDTRNDFDRTIFQQLNSSDAAFVIAAAAGRMLWQQAYQVDYLASCIILKCWRCYKRRQIPKNAASIKNSHIDGPNILHSENQTIFVEDAIFRLHAAMARAVWRQGFVIDYIAASIISHFWRTLKKKRDISCRNKLNESAANDECVPSAILFEDANEAANTDEATEFSIQSAVEESPESVTSSQLLSVASKKAIGALVRASRSGELESVLNKVHKEKSSHFTGQKIEVCTIFPQPDMDADPADNHVISRVPSAILFEQSVHEAVNADDAANEAANTDEATEFSIQSAVEESPESVTSSQLLSVASKKAIGALVRASRSGELESVLNKVHKEKSSHCTGHKIEVCSIHNREALVIASLRSVVGNLESLPHETVAELLVESGIFVASAVTSMTDRLNVCIPLFSFFASSYSAVAFSHLSAADRFGQ